MSNSPKQNVFNPVRVLTSGLGFVFFAVVCLLLSQGAFADTVTVTGMNDATNYADTDIIDNLGASAYNHTGTITGTSSLTVNATIASGKTRYNYRQCLKGADGSYTFTGPVTVNGGQLLVYTSKLSTKTINLNGGDMYVMFADCLPHDAVVNVGSGSFLDVEGAANAIIGATINVSSGGTFRIDNQNHNNADDPIKLNIAGTGGEAYTGAIHVRGGTGDLHLTSNIKLTDNAELFLTNMSTNRQLLLRGKLTGSSTMTFASDDANRWIRLYEGTGTGSLDMSEFAGNIVADKVKLRLYTSSLGTGSNITAQNSATAYFNNTNALNAYNGSFTVNNATISLEANGKLNNLSGDANGKVSFGSKTLTLNNTSNTTFNGTLDGTGAITKNGSGELTLTKALSGVNISATAGTLVLGTANNEMKVGSASTIKANGGTVRVDGNVVVDSGALTVYGTWTGENGSINVKSGGQLTVDRSYTFAKGITLSGGLLVNDSGNAATVNSPVTISSASEVKADGKDLKLTGGLYGSANLTTTSYASAKWVYLSGEGNFTGNLIVKGYVVTGVGGKGTETATASTTPYLGSGEIQLDGGLLLNNKSYWEVLNTINVVSNSSIRAGYSRPFTFSGAIKGSGKLTIENDDSWIVMKTHSDNNNPFTGDVQINWNKDGNTVKQGMLRLAVDQPFGDKAGQANIYGTLDMNGFSQRFNGLYNNGNKGSIYNNNTNPLSTLTIDTTGKALTFQSAINGKITLDITGTGTQTFANNGSNFTGNVVINGGKVVTTASHASHTTTALGAFSTDGGRTITVNPGAELELGTKDALGSCTISNYNEKTVRLIINGGKLSGTDNNGLYNATFQNGAEVYGNNDRDQYHSFWVMGVNTVSFAGDGSTPESPVQFNGVSEAIFVPSSAELNVDDITISDASDLIVNVPFGAYSSITNSVTKKGAGTMEFTKANSYTGGTIISEGVLKYTDDAVFANGPITVGADGTLEYYLSSGKTQKLTIYDTNNSNNKISSTGTIVKTGDGTLQIYTDAAGQVDAAHFLVSSGRLDMKEFFTGSLEVESGATMS
ncbi:MAG: autotransporter-associated beta strand repeat-containing protein, partial [Thermoguttaceae bacterium]|nr:autotransporter-associated beta strand repeat-containing protein [Thermoguttaceae bacterium]